MRNSWPNWPRVSNNNFESRLTNHDSRHSMNKIVASDKLGAFCRHTHAEMKGTPGGPLAGLTFGVKDIYDIAGHKSAFGSPDWLRTHDAAKRTAPGAQRVLG